MARLFVGFRVVMVYIAIKRQLPIQCGMDKILMHLRTRRTDNPCR